MSTKGPRRKSQRGGAAIEYVIVSTFAAVITIAAVAMIGRVIASKLEGLSEKLGVDAGMQMDWEQFQP